MTEKLDKELNYMCNISQSIREEGIQEGKLELMVGLVKDGLITVVEACKRLNISETKFKEAMKKVANRS